MVMGGTPTGRARERSRERARSGERWQSKSTGGNYMQESFRGFKVAVAVIVFHFGVKMLVHFADVLVPFIMAMLLVTVLEPVKLLISSALECSLLWAFQRSACCTFCLRRQREQVGPDPAGNRREGQPKQAELHELAKRVCLIIGIILTLVLAGRLFWVIGRVAWLSGEAVIDDFEYYQKGVARRQAQIQAWIERLKLQHTVHFDMEHIASYALSGLKLVAEFLTQHVFYTVSQLTLTAIFGLFLLYSPVQRDFSPVMRGMFASMETYLKLKTIISLFMGVTNGTILAIIGLDLPAAWGILTFLANFIPNIGGPVMSILPCIIALLDSRKSLYQVLAAFIGQFILHFSIGNFIEPVIFGATEDVHSVVVLLGLSFFGYIWGIIGMFLSVPLLFAIHAWLETVTKSYAGADEVREDARFIMGMLEGRWLEEGAGEEDHVDMLTGQAEGGQTGLEFGSTPMAAHHSSEAKAPLPAAQWAAFDLLELRDKSGDVNLVGVIARMCFVVALHVFLFSGLSVFGLDLSVLIHPSEGRSGAAVAAKAAAAVAATTAGPNISVVAALTSTTMAATTLTTTATAVLAASVALSTSAPAVTSTTVAIATTTQKVVLAAGAAKVAAAAMAAAEDVFGTSAPVGHHDEKAAAADGSTEMSTAAPATSIAATASTPATKAVLAAGAEKVAAAARAAAEKVFGTSAPETTAAAAEEAAAKEEEEEKDDEDADEAAVAGTKVALAAGAAKVAAAAMAAAEKVFGTSVPETTTARPASEEPKITAAAATITTHASATAAAGTRSTAAAFVATVPATQGATTAATAGTVATVAAVATVAPVASTMASPAPTTVAVNHTAAASSRTTGAASGRGEAVHADAGNAPVETGHLRKERHTVATTTGAPVQ
eukprot:NODE_23_length_4278_cov_5.000000.p1 GENE.NODE_23_length_4278_cov_5.000000~~NODE_23_length_4278_cov_5.000000.p1  ORF type:complete len:914 (+),score=312.42 NODE_23_length_4278_cov_5.000000:78-2744(+)